jgi:stage V sporulation protein AB
MTVWQCTLLVLIGLGGGVAVGSGFIAFITVLDIIPRLTQLSSGRRYVRWFEWALVSGVLFFTLIDFFHFGLGLPVLATALFGLLAGVFVGTLAAGLTEVLNVLPILAKRLNMEGRLVLLLMAMVFGKIIGSLLQWLLQL